MKERPILFSAPMVKAILSGSKSQTRRVVKPQPTHFNPAGKLTEEAVAEMHALRDSMTRPALAARFGVAKGTVDDVLDGRTWIARTAPPPNLPRYQRQPGEKLWVRETWMDLLGTGIERKTGDHGRYAYAADTPPGSYGDDQRKAYGLKWRPSIHMPRAASRITLEVTDVRVERLGDVSESDARAEGVQSVAEFKELWASINGPGSWDANPWVWVVSFRRMSDARQS